MTSLPVISRIECFAYKIPTDGLEADGTLQWDSTTLIAVRIRAGAETGLGCEHRLGQSQPVHRTCPSQRLAWQVRCRRHSWHQLDFRQARQESATSRRRRRQAAHRQVIRVTLDGRHDPAISSALQQRHLPPFADDRADRIFARMWEMLGNS